MVFGEAYRLGYPLQDERKVHRQEGIPSAVDRKNIHATEVILGGSTLEHILRGRYLPRDHTKILTQDVIFRRVNTSSMTQGMISLHRSDQKTDPSENISARKDRTYN